MNATNPYSPPNSEVGGDTFVLPSAPDHPLNPWISIWTRPRETVQQIVDTNPDRWVLLLAAISGVSGVLDRASMQSLGDKIDLSMILVVALLFGPIGGLISLHIGAVLLRWAGSWIGGRASSRNIRAAIAWASVPTVYALALWVPELALFREELFTTETPRMDANPSLAFSMIGFGLIEFTIGIWTIVLLLKTLGQVQGFSAWKALGNFCLAILIVAVPIGLAILIGFGVMRSVG